jgi:hypothetical protein
MDGWFDTIEDGPGSAILLHPKSRCTHRGENAGTIILRPAPIEGKACP